MKVVRRFFRWTDREGLNHVWPLVFYLLGYLVWFHAVEAIPRRHYVQVILLIDRYIPFNELFVVPYLSWFLYIAVGIIIAYLADRDRYDEMVTFLIIGMTAFLLISTFIPNRQPLRLVEMPRDNVFSQMVAGVWRTDTPTNVFPSIHVFNTTAIIISLLRCRGKLCQFWLFRVVIVIWGVLIVFSTVYIKQHSMFDVFTALALIIFCWIWVIVRKHVLTFRRWDAWVERVYQKHEKSLRS